LLHRASVQTVIRTNFLDVYGRANCRKRIRNANFIGCFLSGIGVYDSIGAVAGAGSMVPITGFANSVVSPALEFKSEGMIYGLAAKMFIIAGPIIVYGVLTSALVGVIYYFVYL